MTAGLGVDVGRIRSGLRDGNHHQVRHRLPNPLDVDVRRKGTGRACRVDGRKTLCRCIGDRHVQHGSGRLGARWQTSGRDIERHRLSSPGLRAGEANISVGTCVEHPHRVCQPGVTTSRCLRGDEGAEKVDDQVRAALRVQADPAGADRNDHHVRDRLADPLDVQVRRRTGCSQTGRECLYETGGGRLRGSHVEDYRASRNIREQGHDCARGGLRSGVADARVAPRIEDPLGRHGHEHQARRRAVVGAGGRREWGSNGRIGRRVVSVARHERGDVWIRDVDGAVRCQQWNRPVTDLRRMRACRWGDPGEQGRVRGGRPELHCEQYSGERATDGADRQLQRQCVELSTSYLRG